MPGCGAGLRHAVGRSRHGREGPVDAVRARRGRRFAPNLDPALWRWTLRWLGECRASRFKVNKDRMQRLAYYSSDVMTEWRNRHGFAYERTQGLLQLLRGDRDLAMAIGRWLS